MAPGVDRGDMKIKIQITIESDAGNSAMRQEVAQLDRGTLRPETLGLTLAEARSILAGIEQTVVEQQAAEFIAQQRTCSRCSHERSCKGRHHIVFRTPFGKLRLESPRLYHCQCESDDRTSFSPLAELLQERSSPELVYLETKFAALVSYGLGFVNRYDIKPKRRLFEMLKSQGMQMNQAVTFLSDGGDTVRDLQMYLTPQAEHLLDWFHISMRLTVMSQLAKSIGADDQPNLNAKIEKELERLKWNLWHGNRGLGVVRRKVRQPSRSDLVVASV